MAGWIERLAAERARRASGLDQRLGSAHEVPSGHRHVDPDAEQVGTVLGVVGQLDVLAILGRSSAPR